MWEQNSLKISFSSTVRGLPAGQLLYECFYHAIIAWKDYAKYMTSALMEQRAVRKRKKRIGILQPAIHGNQTARHTRRKDARQCEKAESIKRTFHAGDPHVSGRKDVSCQRDTSAPCLFFLRRTSHIFFLFLIFVNWKLCADADAALRGNYTSPLPES